MDHIPSLKQYHPSIDCPCGEILEDVTKERERKREKREGGIGGERGGGEAGQDILEGERSRKGSLRSW